MQYNHGDTKKPLMYLSALCSYNLCKIFNRPIGKKNALDSTLESLKAAATSSTLTSSSSVKHAGLYPFLNHSSSKISGIFILYTKQTNT